MEALEARYPRITKWASITVVVILLAVCGTPVLFFWVVPWVDSSICVPRAAGRIGVAPNYDAIRGYIVNHLKSDMTRGEVIAMLQQIGPLETTTSKSSYQQETIDDTRIMMCSYPFNNIELITRYSAAGRFVDYEFRPES
jgi:hypothetical protein